MPGTCSTVYVQLCPSHVTPFWGPFWGANTCACFGGHFRTIAFKAGSSAQLVEDAYALALGKPQEEEGWRELLTTLSLQSWC